MVLNNFDKVELLVANTLNCKTMNFPIEYLGFLIRPTKLLHDDWLIIINKINSRLSNWNGRFLSRAGSLVLINSILSAIPIYWMSMHLFPKWVVDTIDKLRRDFLWSGENPNSSLKCLVNWDTVCKSKKEGG